MKGISTGKQGESGGIFHKTHWMFYFGKLLAYILLPARRLLLNILIYSLHSLTPTHRSSDDLGLQILVFFSRFLTGTNFHVPPPSTSRMYLEERLSLNFLASSLV